MFLARQVLASCARAIICIALVLHRRCRNLVTLYVLTRNLQQLTETAGTWDPFSLTV